MFLPGDHSLQITVNLTEVSNLTFEGKSREDHARIHCSGESTFLYAHCKKIVIKDLTFLLESNEGYYAQSAALVFTNTKDVSISGAKFQNNGAENRAIYSYSSAVTLVGCLFERNRGERGGAIQAWHGTLTLTGCTFTDNYAEIEGGAIYLWYSAMFLRGTPVLENLFTRNSCDRFGGAVYCANCVIDMMGTNHFKNNSAFFSGGAIYLVNGKIKVASANFSYNRADNLGGALYLMRSSAVITGSDDVMFTGNLAATAGGGAYCWGSELIMDSENLHFTKNVGGAIYITNYDSTKFLVLSGNFDSNTGKCGGVSVDSRSTTTFKSVSFTNNSESALCIHNSRVDFIGTTQFTSNTGVLGGAIISKNSLVSSLDSIVLAYNKAVRGGAIYSISGSISFANSSTILGNTASKDGGALYTVATTIHLANLVSISDNSAQRGGAMFLTTTTFLRLGANTTVSTSQNHASSQGGVIYSEDYTVPAQCEFKDRDQALIEELPYCFLQSRGIVHRGGIWLPDDENPDAEYSVSVAFNSFNDSAGGSNNIIHGGLFDRCKFDILIRAEIDTGNTKPLSILPYEFLTEELIHSNASNTLTSLPYKLCFCESIHMYDCSIVQKEAVHRGQTFRVHLLATAVQNTPTATLVSAKVRESARLGLNQSSQVLQQQCVALEYNIYSTEEYEELILYPEGPCRDTGLARAVIGVTLLPCPDGFVQSAERCICEKRLQACNARCTIGDEIYVTRTTGFDFWVSTWYINQTYQGLILYKYCPATYCKKSPIDISLDQPDQQCANNRSGLLCGNCAVNYSLILGSSRCEECSNTYLALLLPFAVAGIALVIILSVLRLTVATAMINSVILYANIVQANKETFFNNTGRNILTLFIAWMNLDLGIETCFYDGLSAYELTWLQFAFPMYIWVLLSLIVVFSRYSILVSKMVGHNPIAVLATLLLMSYTKILKIIIDVYNFAKLEYPDDKTVLVWRKDANIPYSQSWHLLLAVVTSLVLVFLFLPYTVLLLVGYKLNYLSSRKYFRWFNRLKPLLDSYYAPYKIHTRYWTGLMLLLRCALYTVFALESTNKSQLAIIVAFTTVTTLAWLSVRIYKSFHANVIEASVYINLIVLSAASATNTNSPGLVCSLIGLVFATTLGIAVYRFHLQFTIKSTIWLRIKTNLNIILAAKKQTITPTSVALAENSSQDQQRIVTETVIDLREPLLDPN